MLNLPETIFEVKPYSYEQHWGVKTFILFFGGSKFLDYIRLQVAEVTLLQLVPGLYLSIVFGFSLVVLFISLYVVQFIKELDAEKKFGTKTRNRAIVLQIIKARSSIFMVGTYVLFFGIIPLSFESFTVISTGTVANLWAIDEFLGVETSLAFIIYIIVQFPFFVTGPDYSLSDIQLAPKFLRDYLFTVTLLSGVCTPTVDVATQVNFIIIGISFYLLMTLLIKKNGERIYLD